LELVTRADEGFAGVMSGVEVGAGVVVAVTLSAGLCAAVLWVAVSWVRHRYGDERGTNDRRGRYM